MLPARSDAFSPLHSDASARCSETHTARRNSLGVDAHVAAVDATANEDGRIQVGRDDWAHGRERAADIEARRQSETSALTHAAGTCLRALHHIEISQTWRQEVCDGRSQVFVLQLLKPEARPRLCQRMRHSTRSLCEHPLLGVAALQIRQVSPCLGAAGQMCGEQLDLQRMTCSAVLHPLQASDAEMTAMLPRFELLLRSCIPSRGSSLLFLLPELSQVTATALTFAIRART